MVGAAPLTFVIYPSCHRNNSLRKSCALATVTDFLVSVKKHGIFYAEKNGSQPKTV